MKLCIYSQNNKDDYKGEGTVMQKLFANVNRGQLSKVSKNEGSMCKVESVTDYPYLWGVRRYYYFKSQKVEKMTI